MRHLGMVLVIGFGLGMLQSSVPGATGRATATDERIKDGTTDPVLLGIGSEQVRQYVERQVRPGTTLRFR